jgi:GTP-binding protein Era
MSFNVAPLDGTVNASGRPAGKRDYIARGEVCMGDEIAELLVPEDSMKRQLRLTGNKAWLESDDALQRALAQNVTLAFLGSASSGKDSAIKALFGIDFGDISPIPGSTDRLKAIPLDPAGKVLIVNAPGFGDLRPEVDAVARKVLDTLDIVIYVVNSEGGATIDERRDLDAIRDLGRPVLVCLNKIDLIRVVQRELFITATLEQLGVDRKDAAITAFDPLPQLSQEPIGVEPVINWIHDSLEKSGKDLLVAKFIRNKAAACEPLLVTAARNASLAGAIPVPGADMAAVTAIQVKMIRDIAIVFEQPVDRDVAMFIIGEVMAGGMRGFIRWGVQGMKAAGWIPGTQMAEGMILAMSAGIAAATTYGIGKAAVHYFQSDRKVEAEKLRTVFDIAAMEFKRRNNP